MAKARPQLDKMANGKKKPMSRTSGVARRLTKRDEGIATKLKYGAPLTGSASGVKSISLKDAGEVLTQGIVTLGKKGLKIAPEGLAMALPLGKVAKAAKALRAVGGARNRSVAASLTERLRSKAAGKSFGQSLAENKAAGGGPILQYIANAGARARKASEKVFPRAPKRAKGGRTLQLPDNAEARFKAIDRTFSNLGAVRPAVPGAKKVATFPKRVVGKLPEPGSVEVVKKTAKQFGQKVSGKEAKNISRLLKGRGGK